MGRDIDGTIRFRKVENTAGFSSKKLLNALEQGYLMQKRADQHTQKQTFSPSSLAYGHGTCPRYWYLAFEGNDFVETTDAKGVVTMANGTAAHSRIQEALTSAGVMVAEEVEIKVEDPPIRGFVDCLIRIDDEVVVGEIKTTSQEIFALKQVSMKPSPNHLLQILVYMRATGKDKGFLLYENRNDLSYLVMEIVWTQKNMEIFNDAMEWLRMVRATWEAGDLPKRPFRSQTVKVCSNCPLNKVCWEDKPEGDVKVPKMEIPTV